MRQVGLRRIGLPNHCLNPEKFTINEKRRGYFIPIFEQKFEISQGMNKRVLLGQWLVVIGLFQPHFALY